MIKDSVNNKKLSIGGFLNFEYSPDPNKNWFSGATFIAPFKFQYQKMFLYTGACIDYNIEKYTLNNQYTSNKIERIGPGLYLGFGYNFYKKFNIYPRLRIRKKGLNLSSKILMRSVRKK